MELDAGREGEGEAEFLPIWDLSIGRLVRSNSAVGSSFSAGRHAVSTDSNMKRRIEVGKNEGTNRCIAGPPDYRKGMKATDRDGRDPAA